MKGAQEFGRERGNKGVEVGGSTMGKEKLQKITS